ncbi:glycogen synthase GlgA [Calderihabitans maritimus]|uniref:Glycogen synthase n=1 Tax=Calderihabitans maritimus TaxID=1246530 RepID=A0A1Z5HPY7_9FIRM|nr:glycogen synthase GlgA [Calderihabitans maritimus]GAW91593.1 glycogen/starch synthase [Calderihabitans maritimus]
MGKKHLNILFVASEVAPFAKTGGLADVAGSLPKALAAHGHDVRVVLPRYKQINDVPYLTDFPVEMDGHLETAIVRQASMETRVQQQKKSIPVYLIDNYQYFYRDGLYGHPDDAARFNFFCKAVLSMLPRIDFKPDVIHCNDWQTGPIPLFLKIKFKEDPFYQKIATLFTIHNLQYQGRFDREALKIMALGDEFFTPEQLEFYGQVNYMKAGILYADVLNTVSPKYALEIQTPEMGEGLDGLLRKRGQDLYGIINGIDYDVFDPKTDPRIAVNYDADTLHLKKKNKEALQRELNLPVEDIPVISVISRLVNQKGLDLIAPIIDELMHKNLQLVILGSGEDYYQQLFSSLQVKYRHKMAVKIGFDPDLAQRIYAGSDMFLMPSRFEPCGLGQLISLRYGTIPIVRSTGGLEDTITDIHKDPVNGNGFSFAPYTPEALKDTIFRALEAYYHQPGVWKELMANAMRANYSWSQSALKYLDLYTRAMSKAKATLFKAV